VVELFCLNLLNFSQSVTTRVNANVEFATVTRMSPTRDRRVKNARLVT